MLNIVIIEKDLNFCSMLEKLILYEENWQCIWISATAEDFSEKFNKRLRIDVALVSVLLNVAANSKLISFILAASPDAKIILLTEKEDFKNLLHFFHKGIAGYLLKTAFQRDVVREINTVNEDGALISPQSAKTLLDYFVHPASKKGKPNFTVKETHILNILELGYTYDEMAKILGITKNGVRFHIKNIYNKLVVNKRVDAIRKWKGI